MTILILDPGFGARKLVGPDGAVQLPSQVALQRSQQIHTETMGVQVSQPPLRIRDVDGRSYFVGADAHSWGTPIENLGYDNLVHTPEAMALFYGAVTAYLRQSGLTALTEPITLGLTLPQEMLKFSSDSKKRQQINAIKKAYKGLHQWWADDQMITLVVGRAVITSQAMSAYFDYALDGDGQPLRDRIIPKGKEFGVVSLGHNTLELCVVRVNGRQLEEVYELTRGFDQVGVSALLRMTDPQEHYSLGELDTQLRQGNLPYDRALDTWFNQLKGIFKKTWPRWPRFAGLTVVGGGTMVLNGHLQELFEGKAYIPERPVFAVAEGLYKQLSKR